MIILLFLFFISCAINKSETKCNVILKEKITERVNEDGTSEREEYNLIKILNREKAPNSIFVSYTPYYNEAFIDFVRVIRGFDTIHVDLSNIKDIPAPADLGGTIFWGERYLTIPIVGLKEHDILEYKTRLIGGTWLGPTSDSVKEVKKYQTPYSGYFNYVELFDEFETIIKEKEYNVIVPKSKDINYKIFNGDIEVKRKEKNDSVYYRFSVRNVKPVIYEPLMGSEYDNFKKVIVSNIPSWEEVSRLENELSGKNLDPNEYVKNFTDSLLKDIKEDSLKIKKLFYFVADIRYLGLIEDEREGYTPHNPEITLRKRSGVCKDKAALLVAMLRAAGFKAYYTITSVGSRIENIPSDQTNHAIVAIVNEDTIIYLDPTIGQCGKSLLPPSEWGQEVTIVKEEGDTLREIPYFNIEENMEKLSVETEIKNDTAISYFKGYYTGSFDQRMRRKFTGLKDNEIEDELINIIGVDNSEILSYKIWDSKNFDDFFSLNIQIKNHNIIKIKDINMYRPLSLDYSLPWFLNYGFKKEKRRYPVSLPVSGYSVSETIVFGSDDTILSFPEPFFYEDSFIRLSLSINIDGREMNILREIFIKKDEIPTKNYQNVSEKIKDFERRNEGWVLYRSY